MYTPPLTDRQIKAFLCPPCEIVYDELVAYRRTHSYQTLWGALDPVCYEYGIEDFNLGPLSEYNEKCAPWVRIDGEYISSAGLFCEQTYRNRKVAAEWILHKVMYILRDRISSKRAELQN